MQVITKPNPDWVRPTRLELTMWQALTHIEGRPRTVAEWNDGVDKGIAHWNAAHEHTPALAELCKALLHGLQITDADYDERGFIVRYDTEGSDKE